MNALEQATARFQRAEKEFHAAGATLRKIIGRALNTQPGRGLPRHTARHLEAILEIVADGFQVSIDDMLSRRRTAPFVAPRQQAMVLAYTLLELSTVQVGECFRRDHGTVIHAVRQVRRHCETEPLYASAFASIKHRCAAAIALLEAA